VYLVFEMEGYDYGCVCGVFRKGCNLKFIMFFENIACRLRLDVPNADTFFSASTYRKI